MISKDFIYSNFFTLITTLRCKYNYYLCLSNEEIKAQRLGYLLKDTKLSVSTGI